MKKEIQVILGKVQKQGSYSLMVENLPLKYKKALILSGEADPDLTVKDLVYQARSPFGKRNKSFDDVMLSAAFVQAIKAALIKEGLTEKSKKKSKPKKS